MTTSFYIDDWLADFDRTAAEIIRRYPNLDWVEHRGLDLTLHNARTRAVIKKAAAVADAKHALMEYVAAFEDGHLTLSWQQDQCTAAQLRTDESGMLRAPGVKTLLAYASGNAGGIAYIAGRRIGILRIPSFDANRSPRIAGSIYGKEEKKFLSEIARIMAVIDAVGVCALLLDLTGNGGGSDVVLPIIRMLGGKLIEAPRVEIVASPSLFARMEDDSTVLASAYRNEDATGRAVLAPILARLAQARGVQSAHPSNSPPSRATLVSGLFTAEGYVSKSLLPSLLEKSWAPRVSVSAGYRFKPRTWINSLLILVDRGSASATELAAAMLQDAGRAVILGTRTFGAGGGHMGDPEDLILHRINARLRLPDCRRLRRNGSNEVAGITPDIALQPWRSSTELGEQITELLPLALPRATLLATKIPQRRWRPVSDVRNLATIRTRRPWSPLRS